MFLLLPADQRLRCTEVSRAWRALLAYTSLWARLDFCNAALFSEALFRVAVAKAAGQLRAMDLTGIPCVCYRRLVLEAVAANTDTLTELRLDDEYDTDLLRGLLKAAPALQLLQVSILKANDHNNARLVLRNEPPFQAVRLQSLYRARDWDRTTEVEAFCSDLRCHPSLKALLLCYMALDTVAAIGAVVDACIVLRLRTFTLRWCRVAPATLPELNRLIAAGALRELDVSSNIRMFDQAHESTQLFVTAVQASAMTWLRLDEVSLPDSVLEAAALISARPQ